jgi:hypothetical protein
MSFPPSPNAAVLDGDLEPLPLPGHGDVTSANFQATSHAYVSQVQEQQLADSIPQPQGNAHEGLGLPQAYQLQLQQQEQQLDQQIQQQRLMLQGMQPQVGLLGLQGNHMLHQHPSPATENFPIPFSHQLHQSALGQTNLLSMQQQQQQNLQQMSLNRGQIQQQQRLLLQQQQQQGQVRFQQGIYRLQQQHDHSFPQDQDGSL